MKNTLVLICSLLFLAGCTNFPSRFDRLDGDKIRPLAVICDPVDASPGDTVNVRLIADFPLGVPPITWTVALDFKEDPFANDAYEREVVNVRDLGFEDLTSDNSGLDFKFVIPRDVFSKSNDFVSRKALLSGITGFPLPQIDSIIQVLDTLKSDTLLPAMYRPFLAFLGCRIKLRAHMVQNIELDVTKLVAVRYGHRLGSSNINRNPPPPRLRILKVRGENLLFVDSTIPSDNIQGYNIGQGGFRLFPQGKDVSFSGLDTVLIEPGFSYFIKADTGNGVGTTQSYEYLSLIALPAVIKQDTETIDLNFFFQNLDEKPGMVRDSLLLLRGGGFAQGTERPFLPPVDTAMHRFRFHVVLSDARANDPIDAAGKSYAWGEGYFKYSDAYIKAHQ